VILPDGANPPEISAYVVVTGISSWFENEGYGLPAVLIGSVNDMVIFKQDR